MIDVSIIIVNYRARGLTRNCLRTVIADLAHSKLTTHITLINSGKDDATTAMIVNDFPEVELVSIPNKGYSHAVNVGIQHTPATYYFILNPDVMLLEGNIVERLHAYMEHEQNVGIAAPQLLNPDRSVQLSTRLFPTPWVPLYSRTPIGNLRFAKRAMRKYLMVEWNHAENREVDWALGSAFFVRNSALSSTGLMDEQRYFMYVEDTDWCRSFWKAGWKVVYIHDVRVIHFHTRSSASSRGLNALVNPLTRAHIWSWINYFRKFKGQPNPRDSYAQQK